MAVTASGPGVRGLVDLIDPRTRKRRLGSCSRRPRRLPYVGLSVAFLPDGRDLIVEQIPERRSTGPPPLLRRFDGTTGAAEGRRCAWAGIPRSGCAPRPIAGGCS